MMIDGGEIVEFVEVMKQWRRMCKAQDDTICGACSSCPMGDDGKSCTAVYEDEFEAVDFAHIEQTVTEWAAEHPEPKYPTWLEFVKCKKSEGRIEETDNDFVKWMAETPIPADIAEKLGIEPKEG